MAIIFLIMGTFAEIPLVFAIVQTGIDLADEKRNYENLENKVNVGTDRLEDEFEYNGETLVRVDEVGNKSDFHRNKQKMELVANLIFNNSDEDYAYVELKKVENASGCDIYFVHYSVYMYYVKKEDKEKVIQYYQSEAECIAEVCYDKQDWFDVEIDIQRIRDIVANTKTKEKREKYNELGYYNLEVNSVDYVWGGSYSFSFFEDCVLFQPEYKKKKTIVKGYLLSKEDEAYIREVFEKAMAEKS